MTTLGSQAPHTKRERKMWSEYRDRIDLLSEYGEEDGIEVNADSEADFWAFMDLTGYSRRASLALMDNGDICAVWKGDDGEHLSLHFLGDRSVQYVIFKRRVAGVRISRVAGMDTFDGIQKQTHAFDLTSLVNE